MPELVDKGWALVAATPMLKYASFMPNHPKIGQYNAIIFKGIQGVETGRLNAEKATDFVIDELQNELGKDVVITQLSLGVVPRHRVIPARARVELEETIGPGRSLPRYVAGGSRDDQFSTPSDPCPTSLERSSTASAPTSRCSWGRRSCCSPASSSPRSWSIWASRSPTWTARSRSPHSRSRTSSGWPRATRGCSPRSASPPSSSSRRSPSST